MHIQPRVTHDEWGLQHGLEAPHNQGLADPDADSLVEYLFDTDPLQNGPLPIQYTTDGSFPIPDWAEGAEVPTPNWIER